MSLDGKTLTFNQCRVTLTSGTGIPATFAVIKCKLGKVRAEDTGKR